MATIPGHTFHQWVRIVLDAAYGEQLATLPADQPVWIIGSSDNKSVAQRLWQVRPATSSLTGITTFTATAETREQALIDMLDTVDEHQGETAAGGGYGTLEVIGCQPNDEIEAALAELCLVVVKKTEQGFIAKRGWAFHIKPRLEPTQPGFSLDVIFRECGISDARFQYLQADVRRHAAEMQGGEAYPAFELRDDDWSLLDDVQTYIWYSDWDPADKFASSIEFYDRLPHYSRGLLPLYHFVREHAADENQPEIFPKIWDALAHYLGREEAWYYNTVDYVLGVEFFEDSRTVETAWRGLLASPRLTELGRRRLRHVWASVPFHLKELYYR